MGLTDSTIETKEESLAQMAHDMRAPLMALKAAMSVKGEMNERKLALIKNSIIRLENLAQEILEKNKTVSRAQSQCLIEASQKIIEEFKLHSPCNIDFHLYSHSHEVLMRRETVQSLERIMSILISNAIEASSATKLVRVSLFNLEDKVVIEVTDQGCGINENHMRYIGEKGFTHNKKNGNGLGLSFVKEKLQGMNGKMSVTSELQKGTTFKIELQAI